MPNTTELARTLPPALVEGAFAAARVPLGLAARVTGRKPGALVPLGVFDRVQAEVEVRLGQVLHVELLTELGLARRVRIVELAAEVEQLEERRAAVEAERSAETAKAAQRDEEFARQARLHAAKAADRPVDSPVIEEETPRAIKQRKAARREATAKLARLSHEENEIDATFDAISSGGAPES